MIQIREKSDSENWKNIRGSFYKSLTSPFDGMWDELIHDHSQLWGMYDEGQIVGYCSKDNEGNLTNFFLIEKYSHLKFELFKRVLYLLEARHAIVSTNNPDFLVVSLEKSKKMAVHSYLFENSKKVELSKPKEIEALYLEMAQEQDLENLTAFCQKNSGGDPNWLKGYLNRLIDRKELRLLKKENKIIGYSETRQSTTQNSIADLGVIVDVSFHKKGIGSWLMAQAKEISLAQGNVPICSCEHSNIGSRKMIENAGFVSKNMILKITF
jgi:predicted acetyltransferase